MSHKKIPNILFQYDIDFMKYVLFFRNYMTRDFRPKNVLVRTLYRLGVYFIKGLHLFPTPLIT